MQGSHSRKVMSPGTLLGPDDGPAANVINENSTAPLVLVCDHASNFIPKRLNQLGLRDESLSEHVALDIGAGAVTRKVADILGLCAVLCGYSRLVIDCNRYLADPSAFNEISDTTVVPGNLGLSEADKALRIESIRDPYHAAIESVLNARSGANRCAGMISIHSFTPHMDGFARPWHVGVLWDRDERFALPLLEHFANDPAMCVGDNMPYSGRHPADYTVDHHGERQGRPCASLEIRQDLLADEDQQDFWARHIADGLKDLLDTPELFVKRGADHNERHE